MSSACRHEWSEDYVCTACGTIKYGSAPLWAFTVKIPCGPRGAWLAAWTCADRDTSAPDPVYPSNRLLAERAGGVEPRTVQRQLEWLALAGWVRIVERGGQRYIYLAWSKPRQDWADAAMADADAAKIVMGGAASNTTTILTAAVSSLASEQPGSSPPHDDLVAHTLDDLGSTLDEHLGGASEFAPAAGHPCTVEDSPGVTHARVPEPPRSQPRKLKSGQAALDIPDAPEPDAIAELLADHERLRNAAQAAHGQRQTALPSPTSDTGRSLRLRLRKAVDEHGLEVCRRALEHRAREWAEDPGALARWSTDSMWSPKSLAVSISQSAGQPRARASPRSLPVEPNAPRRDLPGFTWTEPNP